MDAMLSVVIGAATVVFGVAATCAAVWLALAARGRMSAGRGRCARCDHELHDPLPKRCAECGAELAAPDAIAWGVPRSSRASMVSAAILGSITAVAFLGLVVIHGIVGGVVGGGVVADPSRVIGLSPSELGELLATAEMDDPRWLDVSVAIFARRFDRPQAMAVAEGALRRMMSQIDAEAIIGGYPMTIFGDILLDPRIENADLATLFERVAGPVVLHAPTLVRRGAPVFLVPEGRIQRLDDFLPELSLRLVVLSAEIDGAPVPLGDAPTDGLPGANMRMGKDPPRAVALPPQADPPPEGVVAEHEVNVTIGLVIDFPGGPFPRLRAGTDAESTMQLSTEESTITVPLASIDHRVEIVSDDEPLPRVLSDPALADRVRAAIAIDRLALVKDLDGTSTVVHAIVRFQPISECALSFDVEVRLGAESVALGHVWAEQPAYEAMRMTWISTRSRASRQRSLLAWTDPIPADVVDATVIFTPRDSEIIRRFGSDRRWNEAATFERVPLLRLDFADADAGQRIGTEP